MNNIETSKVTESQNSYQVGSKNLSQLMKRRETLKRIATRTANFASPIKNKNSNNNSPFKGIKPAEPQQSSPQFEKRPIAEDQKVIEVSTQQLSTYVGGAKRNQQTSGESMSTNDQSNPSPNMPGNDMQTRNQILKGLTSQEALEQYDGELTQFEMTELTSFDFIYTVGSIRVSSMRQKYDKDGFYLARVGEQLGYRYLIDKIIDAGAFGQVVRCIDMKDSGRTLAIKISKNKK